MTSLLAQPYRKLDQEQVDTKIPEDIVDGRKGPEEVDNSDTPAKGNGTPSGDWEKRYKDLQSFHDREVAKLKKDLANSKEKEFVLPSSTEEIEAFSEKHPELFKVIKSIAMQEGKTHSDTVRSEVDGLKKQVSKSQALELKAKIKEVHPDFESIIASKEFNAWVDDESVEVQNWVRKNPDNANLAIAALDLYKAKTGYSGEKSASKKNSTASADAAQSVKTGSSPQIPQGEKIWKASEIKAMTPRQFDKYEKEIDKAMDEGRIDFNS